MSDATARARLTISYFRETQQLFREYLKRKKYLNQYPSTKKENERDLCIEANRRIRQLDIILNAIQEAVIDLHNRQYHETIAPEELQYKTDFLWILTETFYYYGFRLISLLDRLPDFKGLKSKCKSVGQVRNQLLEHPESRNSGVFKQTFGWGSEEGPIIKMGRHGDQWEIFQDAGLYVNAEELKESLDTYLKAFLAVEA